MSYSAWIENQQTYVWCKTTALRATSFSYITVLDISNLLKAATAEAYVLFSHFVLKARARDCMIKTKPEEGLAPLCLSLK